MGTFSYFPVISFRSPLLLHKTDGMSTVWERFLISLQRRGGPDAAPPRPSFSDALRRDARHAAPAAHPALPVLHFDEKQRPVRLRQGKGTVRAQKLSAQPAANRAAHRQNRHARQQSRSVFHFLLSIFPPHRCEFYRAHAARRNTADCGFPRFRSLIIASGWAGVYSISIVKCCEIDFLKIRYCANPDYLL